MEKKPLTLQEFIFRSATELEFRKKYFANPRLLAKDYEVKHIDLESIERINFGKLEKELKDLQTSELIKADLGMAANHCNSSHALHSKDAHTQNSHTNGCDDILTEAIQQVILPQALVKLKTAMK